MNFRVNAPIETWMFLKGHLDVVNGLDPNVLIIHVYLYDKAHTKKWDTEIANLEIPGLSSTSEYIPELDSWCIEIKKKELKVIKNLLIKKVKGLFEKLLD